MTSTKTRTYRAMQVDRPGAAPHLVEKEFREPGPGQVRVAVEACGVCHTDAVMIEGGFPGAPFPMVPGHEIAGRIDAIGDGVEEFEKGQRVAVGWFGGNCGHCVACRDGDAINCATLQTPGLAYPGGYADTVVVPASALARIPDGFSFVDAAPMGCAGVTVCGALSRSAARPGDLVAIIGVGGLGHLGVQFADKMGFETVAIARGKDKEPLARELGARHYIDNRSQDVAAELRALGGAKVVLNTATNSKAATDTLDGLGHRGELIVIALHPEPLQISTMQLITGTRKVYGHASGTSREVEETLRFAALTGIRPMTEEVPLTEAGPALDKMLASKARFRMVLTSGPGH
ncbi:alcohol dehydrogenase catalytic domain-containing protein [Streptomyces sp. SID4917]|uniref:alcohol dehydrogenase catalytic domain-containing protein n=2 Tax=unclassified Streptomyces TaxID=2593676 RepID=UPI00081E017E|nr:alcohol dehydrogenase catalytic domain-containing protein [Streptomyces sp. SID4917]SCF89716.1 alcohol dehydrogenase [Streptomyces sp. MnatMP-M17]